MPGTRKEPRRKTIAGRIRTGAPTTAKSFPVVGIGASAGGYEAYTKFLEQLPADTGMAFVLVQHLDPTHESKLTELLGRATSLPVVEVERAVAVRPNHVYVIPPNKNLAIVRRRLKLTPRRVAEMPPMPVDFFLRSLAEDQREHAIGVILSGNGSDGTLGLEAIKGADGITFAQTPQTAKYDGMPASAIASGCVDFVQSPELMARELAKLSRLPRLASLAADKGDQPAAEPAAPLAKIYSLLRSASGVDFTSYKQSTLKRRIARRMVVHRIEKLEDYVLHLQRHPAEVQALFDDVLITVTRFFREPKSFQILAKKVFPALIKGRPRGMPIRIWVPACSSGEEVYSIAISLAEFLGDRAADHPVQIYGTDISEAAVAKARAGIYRANIALDVSPNRLRRFFTQTDEGFRISKSIRDLCVFARQNLCADPPFSKIDIISCQNLLIYLGPELQKRVVPVFHYALQPTGFLLLSPAESVAGLSRLFTQANRNHRLYVKTSRLAQPEIAFNANSFAEDTVDLPAAKSADPEPVLLDLEKAADRVLLNHFTRSGVVINNKMQVLQFRGFTAAYLEHSPGLASLNLLKLVRADLALPLRAAIFQALKQNLPVRKEVEAKKSRNLKRQIILEIIPFYAPPAKEPFLLVLFTEGQRLVVSPMASGKSGKSGKAGRTSAEAELHRLRGELQAARESFQAAVEEQEATNEELKSASEEIQSSNEELQSTNEELETAKEEMQSTNEELTTVNDELQSANREASRVNNDLFNLLASVQIPVVMVDNDLAVRRFTPAAQRFFSLVPTDLGRSFKDIKVNLEVNELDQLILEVIETLHFKECQVRDRAGHWHSLCIRPYRTKENRIEGAVLALFDIDELKRSLDQISEVMWEPFLALDDELRVVKASEAFYEKFCVGPEATEGKYLFQLGNGQWDIPRLRALLKEVLPEQSRVRDFPVEHDFPEIGQRKMLLNARRLDLAGDGKKLILLAFRDATQPANVP